MRVWDFSPSLLCNKHLVAQHNEIHSIYAIITEGKKGFSHHPEVVRWKNKLQKLYGKHTETVSAMLERGYEHNSPIPVTLATTISLGLTKDGGIEGIRYPESWQPLQEQLDLLKAKADTIPGCDCYRRIINAAS